MSVVSYIGQRLQSGGRGFYFSFDQKGFLTQVLPVGVIGVKEGTHSQWDQEGSPEAHHSSGNRITSRLSRTTVPWLTLACCFLARSRWHPRS